MLLYYSFTIHNIIAHPSVHMVTTYYIPIDCRSDNIRDALPVSLGFIYLLNISVNNQSPISTKFSFMCCITFLFQIHFKKIYYIIIKSIYFSFEIEYKHFTEN